MSQKTGRVFLKLGADALQSKPGAKLMTGGITREMDMSDDGRVFWSEKITPSQLTCTLIHTSETDLEAIKAFVGGTIEYRCDTGRIYTIPQACYQTDGGLQNGEVEVNFGGAPAIQA
jgi:hypothetical protein